MAAFIVLPSAPASAGSVFDDVDDGSTHAANIAALAEWGITAGCNTAGTLFCPNDPVNRGQMGTFMSRAFVTPTTSLDYFIDDETSVHQSAINSVASAGITQGCGTYLYCPFDSLTRAQMATFLVRALDLPSTGTDYFTDDNGSTHEAAINSVAAADITLGCGGTQFCPNNTITRAQMASFLVRSLEHLGCTA
jgi:hypothetical protein